MKRAGWIAVGLLLAACLAMATTYTAPVPRSSRTDWMTNRYASPVEGLIVVDWTSADINDVSEALETQLSGYLQRIVWDHDGNDGEWSISVADAAGVTIFSDDDANAVNDPCSYVCDAPGIAFHGGLTLSIADANNGRAWADGDGTEVTVRLYIREAWRQ